MRPRRRSKKSRDPWKKRNHYNNNPLMKIVRLGVAARVFASTVSFVDAALTVAPLALL